MKRRIGELKESIEKENRELKNLAEAQKIIQNVAAMVQAQAHRTVSGLVSKCLKTIYGEEYGFEIRFEKKRGKTEASPVLIKGKHEMDLNETTGGGVLDVISFALRVSYLTLSRPELRRFLVLDEPFKNLDVSLHEAARLMLEDFSSKLNIQILMVTHNESYMTGKIIEI